MALSTTFQISGIKSKCDFVGNKANGRISKRVFQENKTSQVFRKTNISYPLGVQNVRFSENLACFLFLKHPFLDSPFYLITDDYFSLNI